MGSEMCIRDRNRWSDCHLSPKMIQYFCIDAHLRMQFYRVVGSRNDPRGSESRCRPGVGSARAVLKIDFLGIFAIIYLTREPEGECWSPDPAKFKNVPSRDSRS